MAGFEGKFYPAFLICWCVHWPYLVVQVYELITCVRRANENAGNLMSVFQFLINIYSSKVCAENRIWAGIIGIVIKHVEILALDLNTNGIHLFIAVSIWEWWRLMPSSWSKKFFSLPRENFPCCWCSASSETHFYLRTTARVYELKLARWKFVFYLHLIQLQTSIFQFLQLGCNGKNEKNRFSRCCCYYVPPPRIGEISIFNNYSTRACWIWNDVKQPTYISFHIQHALVRIIVNIS